MFDPENIKESILKDYDKLIETTILNTRFLYSTVKERKLKEEDFKILEMDGDLYATSRVNAYFVKRIYLGLTHKEQEKLLELAIENSESIKERLFAIMGVLYKAINKYSNDLTNITSQENMLNITGKLASDVMDVLFKELYNRVNKIPSGIFKKIFLNIFKEGLDINYIFNVILEKQKRDAEKALGDKEDIIDIIRKSPTYFTDDKKEKLLEEFLKMTAEELQEIFTAASTRGNQDVLELVITAMLYKNEE